MLFNIQTGLLTFFNLICNYFTQPCETKYQATPDWDSYIYITRSVIF